MHFSSATALLILASRSLSYAAPFSNPQNDDLVHLEPSYRVINVDGGSSTASVETVVETTTLPAPTSQPVTVTVTATPSSSHFASSSSVVATSTPLYRSLETPRPSRGVPLPSGIAPSWWRRGLNAYGSSLAPRGYSWSASAPVSSTPLVARTWGTPYSSQSWPVWSTPVVYAAPSSTPLSATPRFY